MAVTRAAAAASTTPTLRYDYGYKVSRKSSSTAYSLLSIKAIYSTMESYILYTGKAIYTTPTKRDTVVRPRPQQLERRKKKTKRRRGRRARDRNL